ncbi:MAG TPA: hypothetical protein VLA34_02545 [Candidatus Krumholzibacterium sp.]|nr:hypothetical protein [Candidatus Krumholzibacterium sp.]
MIRTGTGSTFVSAALIVSATGLLLFGSCLTDAEKKPEPDSPEPVEEVYDVLFVGSSYFASNDLPGMVDSMVTAAGRKINIEREIVPGTYLDYHATSPVTAEKLRLKDWDFVFLQGGCTNIAYPELYNPYSTTHEDHPVLPSLKILEKKIHENCDSTVMVYFMSQAFEDGMTWKGFPEETYDVMQQRIIDNTLEYAAQVDFVVSPGGAAWKHILAEPDVPLHYLHREDWNHPSLYGSYVFACVVYSTIYMETSEGIPYYSTIDPELAGHFQQRGSTTVLFNPAQWKLPGR